MAVRKDVVTDRGRASARPRSRSRSNGRVSDESGPLMFPDGKSGMVAYGRVSTRRQDHALQVDAARAAGAGRMYLDTESGAKSDRPGLAAVLAYVRRGDVLTVYSLSRLGRSVRDLLTITDDLQARGVELVSTTEAIDTRTPTGRFTYVVLAAVAELERSMLIERVHAGLAAARERGRVGGRPTVLTAEKVAQLRAMLADGASIATAARVVDVGRATIYRWLTENHTD